MGPLGRASRSLRKRWIVFTRGGDAIRAARAQLLKGDSRSEPIRVVHFSVNPVSNALSSLGYFLDPLELRPSIREAVVARDWNYLDRLIRIETLPGGAIFDRLSNYHRFSEIEFIISIRSSELEPDEDGIWHDDGSRVLAFSLSLTLNPEAVVGGRLEIRRRDGTTGVAGRAPSGPIPTPAYGTMIVFATGVWGFEHKINRVSEGERVIIAGWCT